jgi:hypothetical protein
MKLADVVQIIAKELGVSADLKEINKVLKTEPAIKFRIAGKALGHFGFTGQIKNISEEGVKAFMANKVSLIRFADIETFEKAKPRTERPVRPAKTAAPASGAAKKSAAPVKTAKADIEDDDDEDFDDEDFDDDDFDDLRPKKLKKKKIKPVGKSGSKFIPTPKKK